VLALLASLLLFCFLLFPPILPQKYFSRNVLGSAEGNALCRGSGCPRQTLLYFLREQQPTGSAEGNALCRGSGCPRKTPFYLFRHRRWPVKEGDTSRRNPLCP